MVQSIYARKRAEKMAAYRAARSAQEFKPHTPRAETLDTIWQARMDELHAKAEAISNARAEALVDKEHARRLAQLGGLPVSRLQDNGLVRLASPIWLPLGDLTYLRELAEARDITVGEVIASIVHAYTVAET